MTTDDDMRNRTPEQRADVPSERLAHRDDAARKRAEEILDEMQESAPKHGTKWTGDLEALMQAMIRFAREREERCAAVLATDNLEHRRDERVRVSDEIALAIKELRGKIAGYRTEALDAYGICEAIARAHKLRTTQQETK